jgi:hypothetical protein
MQHICVIHFNPIEKYPPVINFLQYASSNLKGLCQVTVITTYQPGLFIFNSLPGICIKRVAEWKTRNKLQRILFYGQFHRRALKWLMRLKPQTVLYYETFSAGAPCIYKKWLNLRCRLFIHYHEYTSKQEYQQGIIVNKWMHQLERLIYAKTAWISHTNADRAKLFRHDIDKGADFHLHVLPNYPPASWHLKALNVQPSTNSRIGFVYVGALSLNTMYTREMALFIHSHPNDYYWDIYSDNHDEQVIVFLQELNAPNIFFKGAILYDDLPKILPIYDIGVILYKGDTFNFRHNAPNKFFEYITCGLNVCYPLAMEGLKMYDRENIKPWVIAIDFNKITFSVSSDLRRIQELPPQHYCSEDVYKTLWMNMINEMGSLPII